jgi:hypothetical protein
MIEKFNVLVGAFAILTSFGILIRLCRPTRREKQ